VLDKRHSLQRTPASNYRFLTPGFTACFAARQLPGFDASVLNPFCFLFSEFGLLLRRRRNPVVEMAEKSPENQNNAASEPGSFGAGLAKSGHVGNPV
jgi:hypothetical protein